MPPSLIGKVSQRLRSLVRGSRDTTIPYEAEIATLGLMERLRHEWQVRNEVSVDERFGLVNLLKTLALDRSAASLASTAAMNKRADTSGAMKTFDAEFVARRRYALAELTGASDPMFLELAYRCVLKRAPDPTGSQQLMMGMQTGTLDRIDVLHALNASFEGRSIGVVIAGLRSKWLWRRAERVRFVGSVFAWLRAMLKARATARRLNALEMRVEARHEQQVALDATRAQSDAAVAALADRFRRLQAEARMQASAADAQARESAERLQRLEGMLERERARVDELCRAIEEARSADPQGPSS